MCAASPNATEPDAAGRGSPPTRARNEGEEPGGGAGSRAPEQAAGRECLAGELTEFSVAELLGTLSATRKSGLLEMSAGERGGWMRLREGRVTDAEVGKLVGREAALTMIAWDAGTFQFRAAAKNVVDCTGRLGSSPVGESVEGLLLESARLEDELGRLRSVASFDDQTVLAAARGPHRLADLSGVPPDLVQEVRETVKERGEITVGELVGLELAAPVQVRLVIASLVVSGALQATGRSQGAEENADSEVEAVASEPEPSREEAIPAATEEPPSDTRSERDPGATSSPGSRWGIAVVASLVVTACLAGAWWLLREPATSRAPESELRAAGRSAASPAELAAPPEAPGRDLQPQAAGDDAVEVARDHGSADEQRGAVQGSGDQDVVPSGSAEEAASLGVSEAAAELESPAAVSSRSESSPAVPPPVMALAPVESRPEPAAADPVRGRSAPEDLETRPSASTAEAREDPGSTETGTEAEDKQERAAEIESASPVRGVAATTPDGSSRPPVGEGGAVPRPTLPELELPESWVGELVEPGPDVVPPRRSGELRIRLGRAERQALATTTLTARLLVDHEGVVRDVELGANAAALSAAARSRVERALSRLAFVPAERKGVPVSMWVTVGVPVR